VETREWAQFREQKILVLEPKFWIDHPPEDRLRKGIYFYKPL